MAPFSLSVMVLPVHVVLALLLSTQPPTPQLWWIQLSRIITPLVPQSLKPPWLPLPVTSPQWGLRYSGGTGLWSCHPRAGFCSSPDSPQVSL